MRFSKYTEEGYHDPTAYAALTNVARKAAVLPLVYICSPYRGDRKANVEKAKRYCRFAYNDGAIPLAPHLLYPQFMDDSDSYERRAAMHFDIVLLGKCDELWVFGNRISSGMAEEIREAERLNMRVRDFTEEDLKI